MATKIYIVEGKVTEDIEANSEEEAIRLFDEKYDWCEESDVIGEYEQ